MRIQLDPGFAMNLEIWGAGPPLVLLHGFTGSGRAWGPFGDILSARYTLVAPDITGHGQTDLPDALDHYRMSAVVEDVVEAVRRAGYSKADWLGYSMGGRLALHLAAAHPEVVDRLILVGASPGLATEGERAARRASDEELALRLERHGVEPFIDYWQSIPLFASQRSLPAERQAAIRAGRLANSAHGLAGSLRGMGTGAQEPLFEALHGLAMPSLLITGALDEKFTAIGVEMAATMPRAKHIVIPGAGHAAQTDQPEACAAEVAAFLAVPSNSSTKPQGVPA